LLKKSLIPFLIRISNIDNINAPMINTKKGLKISNNVEEFIINGLDEQ
jgi:hypothetical protein